MDFGNESDERAREGECRVRELEEQVRNMSDVMKKQRVESDRKLTSLEEEERLVDSFWHRLLGKMRLSLGVCSWRRTFKTNLC
ncbi:hypothetical protein Bca52824_006538 [Brassica carinata]|uniref:Uncharacterized protein n=1 Tax=Brassica carinata TaxID=52824 RepID=A0A8X7W7H4_BRACI|nr:hypothetical protein Bca52824_006538 [Brassica carinata]